MNTLTGAGGPGRGSAAHNATFSFNGAAQSFVVPVGVVLLTVDARGAQGSDGSGSGGTVPGGKGGRVQCTLVTVPGETLQVNVGGQSDMFNGFGATDIRQGGTALANRKVTAGAGGWSGLSDITNPAGGLGGGTTATAGQDNGYGGSGGGGGTALAGGAGGLGSDTDGANGTAGTLGTGGDGGGQGGGGGNYGGGSGGFSSDGATYAASAAGGGGSSATGVGTASVVHTQGFQTGDGQVLLSW